jgi:cell division protein FtsZ
MTFKVFAPQTRELKPRIVVFGVGGAGGNAVNNMIEAGLEGVEFVVANTDAQQLAFSKTEKRIQLGVQVTQGLGAGAHPDVGMTAAEESTGEIGEHLDGAHMIFITAGMGGGTGTGAGPIIAKCARERGILTVGVVTKPFHFEGRHRMRLADAGIAELQRYVDTLIVIPNQNLFRVANERTTFAEAFGMADQVLHSGVRSITDLMVLPGLINLDFADVRTVMTEMGKAMMGTGEASGEGRALMAAENAIQNPLLDEVTLKGAKAVLVNITGGLDMTLLEVDEAANAISAQVDPDANIIFGAAFDPSLQNTVRVSVVATGMDGASISAIEPHYRRVEAVARQPEPRYVETVVEVPHPEPVAVLEPEPMFEPEPVFQQAVVEEPIPVSYAPVATSQPKVFEPLRATAYRQSPLEPTADQTGFAFEEPAQQTPVQQAPVQPAPVYAAPEPQIVQPAVKLIVDPSVADADDEPLFPSTHYAEERRPQKSGFFSLFGGRPRHEPQAAAGPSMSSRSMGGAQPAMDLHEDTEADAGEDLEIPSFLRRLAN